MELRSIETLIEPVLKDASIHLVDLKWLTDQGTRILQIAIMFDDGSMDLDTCSRMSEKISALLDDSDLKDSEYYLEVCSPGAERPLNGPQDIQRAVGGNVHVTLIHPIEKSLEHEGTLIDFNGTVGHLEIIQKTRKKLIEFTADNLLKIRLAVKL